MLTAAKVGLLIGVGWVRGVLGFFEYQARFPNGGNVIRNGQAWPGVGHAEVFGGGPRNSFGVDFATAGHQWTETLCRKDSDGDGQSNGLELGDPDCVWTVGATPARTADISHPGYADSLTQAIPTTTSTITTTVTETTATTITFTETISTVTETVTVTATTTATTTTLTTYELIPTGTSTEHNVTHITETTTVNTLTTTTATTTFTTVTTTKKLIPTVTSTEHNVTSTTEITTVTTTTTITITLTTITATTTLTATTAVTTLTTTVTATTQTSTATTITSTAKAAVTTTATITTTQDGTETTTEATTTVAGTTTTDTSTRFVISHVQGSLILSASYSTIFAGDAPVPGIKTALEAAIAEIASVDTSAVVVTLTLPRRLQLDTAEISIAYTIVASANEAAVVGERITSTDLDSATLVVSQHLSNAGIDGAVTVVGLSANITGGDAGTIAKHLLAVWIGVGVGGGIGVLIAVLCCCCFYRYCCHGSGKAVGQKMSSPTLTRMEEGKGDKHAVLAI